MSYDLIERDDGRLMPPRSKLVRLMPIALDTPYRESFSSYLLRLAHAHHLAPHVLCREIIFPVAFAADPEALKFHMCSRELRRLNGISAEARTWVDAVARLTGQPRVRELSLAPYASVLSALGTLARHAKWCPLCINEDLSNGRHGYSQLLWEFADVAACPKHAIRLQETCGCGEQGVTSAHPIKKLPHICGWCGRQMVAKEIVAATSEEIDRATLVAEFLRLPATTFDAGNKVGPCLARLMKHFTDGLLTPFARMLGVQKSTLHAWLYKSGKPVLSDVLRIARGCQCSVAHVLTDSIDIRNLPAHIEFGERVEKPKGCRTGRRKDRDIARLRLAEIAEMVPPMSLSKAVAAAGVTTKFVGQHFPDLRDQLRDQYAAYVRAKEGPRSAAIERAALDAAARLTARGIYPSRRAVRAEMCGEVRLSPRTDDALVGEALKSLRRLG